DLWCFARLRGGDIEKLIDLPVLTVLSPAADEAWRLQAALDALADHPQVAEVEALGDGSSLLHLFAPVPSWVHRRLEVIGSPAQRQRGALFTFEVPISEVDEEIESLRELLWLSVGQV